ncbi:hypothetical protein RRG08_003152 [Elysia crispata]|uniref:Uncharacterized protein n=1 Tax=Elysia crispata TaxID=231223 RepID=A0AAE1EBC7_9GAST|nr:hypothetical protein RRG08_003152 [Elysia crispata]
MKIKFADDVREDKKWVCETVFQISLNNARSIAVCKVAFCALHCINESRLKKNVLDVTTEYVVVMRVTDRLPQEEIRLYVTQLGSEAARNVPTNYIDVPYFWSSVATQVPNLAAVFLQFSLRMQSVAFRCTT